MSPTFALPALSNSASSLDSYIHTINSYPMLSLEEEISLGRRLRDDNDLEAAGHLVMSHLRVVVSIARKYVGYGLPQADLIQEGQPAFGAATQ